MKPPRMPNASRPTEQISPALSALTLLGGMLFSTATGAVGLGEITLHSRIGENLLAEVQLHGTGKEISDPACFTLTPHPESDLPVVTHARLRLSHSNNSYRLLIVGNKTITEPVFTIRLRAGCDIDLQHDYVLMPDAPAPPAENPDNAAPASDNSPPSRATASDRPIRETRSQRPFKPQRQLAAAPGRQPAARRSAWSGSSATRREIPAPDKASGDHLILSTAPLELEPGETPAPASIDAMEERVLKMETSLRILSQEVETLNTSLTLSSEMVLAKRELQLAQSLQQAPVTVALTTPVQGTFRPSSSDNWLELGLSTLLGCTMAAGLAAFLGRRKNTDNRPS